MTTELEALDAAISAMAEVRNLIDRDPVDAGAVLIKLKELDELTSSLSAQHADLAGKLRALLDLTREAAARALDIPAEASAALARLALIVRDQGVVTLTTNAGRGSSEPLVLLEGERVAVPADMYIEEIDGPGRVAADSRLAWAFPVLRHGGEALIAATALLLQGGPFEERTSVLSSLTDLVAKRMKRGLLLEQLQRHGWNLTRTGETLGLSGSANVLRAIKDLDLSAEYAQAKGERER